VGTLAVARLDDLVVRQERPFDEVVVGFLVGYDKAHTRAAYRSDLRCFAAWCAQTGLDPLGVSRAHLDVYARSLEASGLAASSVARRLSTLSGLFRYAYEEGHTARNPAANVRRPRVGDDSPTLGLDLTEARSFLQAAEAAGPRDHALVCLLLLNGLRVSEVCSTLADDVAVERGHRVLVIQRKGGRRDLIPLAPRTTAAIDEHLADRGEGPLLLANDGGPLNRFQATRIVRRLTRAAGIGKHISPHSLRHTAVTLALDAGVPLRDVQDMAGHADPRTTRRYDRARESLDRHATYTLASYVA
jgi:site-specific recombinase XerD